MLKFVDVDGTSRCPDPFSTMESVKSCPQSKKSLMKAANRKACQQIYVNCIGLPKQDMEYHCLYNPIINGYVEVCAPSRRIDSGNYQVLFFLKLIISCAIAFFPKPICCFKLRDWDQEKSLLKYLIWSFKVGTLGDCKLIYIGCKGPETLLYTTMRHTK